MVAVVWVLVLPREQGCEVVSRRRFLAGVPLFLLSLVAAASACHTLSNLHFPSLSCCASLTHAVTRSPFVLVYCHEQMSSLGRWRSTLTPQSALLQRPTHVSVFCPRWLW